MSDFTGDPMANGYLSPSEMPDSSKPVDRTELAAVIRRIVGEENSRPAPVPLTFDLWWSLTLELPSQFFQTKPNQ